jgi:hypothetical protein
MGDLVMKMSKQSSIGLPHLAMTPLSLGIICVRKINCNYPVGVTCHHGRSACRRRVIICQKSKGNHLGRRSGLKITLIEGVKLATVTFQLYRKPYARFGVEGRCVAAPRAPGSLVESPRYRSNGVGAEVKIPPLRGRA